VSALPDTSYGLLHIAPEIDSLIVAFYKEEVGSYWPAERGPAFITAVERLWGVPSRRRLIRWPLDVPA
jgi:hypothetical protein